MTELTGKKTARAEHPDSLRIQIVTGEGELEGLSPAWNDLYLRAHMPFVTQSFEWMWCVWKTLMKGGRLRCVVLWQDNRLVLAWPLVIVPYRRFWTAQMPIATGGDYVDFLVESSPAALDYGQLAWANRSSQVDMTVLNRVRVSSVLHQAVTRQGVKPIQHLPAHYESWEGCDSWKTYYNGLTERHNIERRRRRLSARGEVSFRATEELGEVRTLTEWLLRKKAVWLTSKGRQSSWVGVNDYENFILSIPSDLNQFGYVAAFALMLEQTQPIAVQINIIGTSRIILFHSADDQEFRQFSAQHVLTLQVMQWAYERKLTVDFCAGSEPFKKAFAPTSCPVEDYRIPESTFGNVHELALTASETRIGQHVNRMIRRVTK